MILPTMFIDELEGPRYEKFDLSSLRTGIMAGAPCPTELMKRVIDEIKAFCKKRVAHLKIPRYIWFVVEFPMT